MDGTVSYLTMPLVPEDISPGDDGDIWLSAGVNGEPGTEVLHVTPQGVAATYEVAEAQNVSEMVETPDGNLWFVDDAFSYDNIGVLQLQDGHSEEFPIDSPCGSCIPFDHGQLFGLVWANGYLWVTETFGSQIPVTPNLWRLTITSS